MAEKQTTMKNTDTQGRGYAEPFTIHKRVRSTVYFSKTSRKTLRDKILRLIRNEASL